MLKAALARALSLFLEAHRQKLVLCRVVLQLFASECGSKEYQHAGAWLRAFVDDGVSSCLYTITFVVISGPGTL